jgi:hypothetical protein
MQARKHEARRTHASPRGGRPLVPPARPAAGQAPTTPRLESMDGGRPVRRGTVLVNLRRASRRIPFDRHRACTTHGCVFLWVGGCVSSVVLDLCGSPSPWSPKSRHPDRSSIPERVRSCCVLDVKFCGVTSDVIWRCCMRCSDTNKKINYRIHR